MMECHNANCSVKRIFRLTYVFDSYLNLDNSFVYVQVMTPSTEK